MSTYMNAEMAYSRLTNSMEQGPAWRAGSSLANQEIYRNLWNLKIHHRVHKGQPLFYAEANQSTPSQTSSLRSILISSSM